MNVVVAIRNDWPKGTMALKGEKYHCQTIAQKKK